MHVPLYDPFKFSFISIEIIFNSLNILCNFDKLVTRMCTLLYYSIYKYTQLAFIFIVSNFHLSLSSFLMCFCHLF